jgi:hypothetical protein
MAKKIDDQYAAPISMSDIRALSGKRKGAPAEAELPFPDGKLTSVTLRVNGRIYNGIKAVAHGRDESIGIVVNKALHEYLDRTKPGELETLKGSC